MEKVNIIGGGLAGAEAAWQIAKRGGQVNLYEMRPNKMTPAHTTADFAELVCSNSLRAANIENAVGLLKEEMRRLDSLIMACADQHKVPAGVALAVDRTGFSQCITKTLESQPNINIIRQEVTAIPEGLSIIASGPLTSESLNKAIAELTGSEYLFFHDAVAPIVSRETINMDKAFFASRYDKGEDSNGDYINCPLNEEEYNNFYQQLITAEVHDLHNFEKEKTFDGCMPVESMAYSGEQTLRFGPLKPVGLIDPHTGKEPYAVVQLRQDNAEGTMYNLVGFQTRLKIGEQKRVFALIPGLENAEFLRYGKMHRNTYLNSPVVLNADLTLKNRPDLLFAGQITGVEGYIESAACGLLAGINGFLLAQGQDSLIFPQETALGSLTKYITTFNTNFQPMNITFGLIPAWPSKIRKKKEKNGLIAARSLESLEKFIAEKGLRQD